MKAISLPRYGGPEAFEPAEVEPPVAAAGEVLVRVHATSIDPLDDQVRRGDHADLVPLPAITGHDVSGVVEAVGSGVTAFKPGDEVWYTAQIFGGPGSYAEHHVAREAIVGRKPAALPHLEAACLSLVGGTLWEALFTRAGLRLGETILVHGAAGGVGHVAVQAARATGAFVIATASAGDADFVRGLGADVVIDCRGEDYVEVVNRKSDGAGVDVVLATTGATRSRAARMRSPSWRGSSPSSTSPSRRT